MSFDGSLSPENGVPGLEYVHRQPLGCCLIDELQFLWPHFAEAAFRTFRTGRPTDT